MSVLQRLRNRIAHRVTSVFKHADYPLANTLDHRGDPGLCGPDSVSWRVIGDPAAFVGGVRALMLQAAHPEVAAGVSDHSRYEVDPLGRLSRTSSYITATTFGAMPEVEAAVDVVRRMHRRVRGVSHRGRRYQADAPELAAWVHNVLTDSFLAAYEAFGPRRLTASEADRFVTEQARVGSMLEADPVPRTVAALREWVAGNAGVGGSPGMTEAIGFLHRPPLRGGIRLGYAIIRRGAVATIPRHLRRLLGVRRVPGAIVTTRLMMVFLRWAVGSSPTWKLALIRVGAPIPTGLFKQPLPIESLDEWGTGPAGRR